MGVRRLILENFPYMSVFTRLAPPHVVGRIHLNFDFIVLIQNIKGNAYSYAHPPCG